MWEDEANKTGGRWLINFDKRQQNQELDRIWLDIVCYYILSRAFIIKMHFTHLDILDES